MTSKGSLIDGKWVSGGAIPQDKAQSKLDDEISDFNHSFELYISNTCPFALSSLFAYELKQIPNVHVTRTDNVQNDGGWSFEKSKDPLHPDFKNLHQVYTDTDPNYTGKSTVPVLFDKNTNRVVSNTSLKVIELFNKFPTAQNKIDLFPSDLANAPFTEAKIQSFNVTIFKFALSENEQEKPAIKEEIHKGLKAFDDHFSKNKFILGDNVSAVDIRLFAFLLGYAIYSSKSLKLQDIPFEEQYPNLNGFLKRFYRLNEGITKAVKLDAYVETTQSITFLNKDGFRLTKDDVPNFML